MYQCKVESVYMLLVRYRVGMVGRKYQWLIMGTYSEKWWLDESAPCSPEQLLAALEGCILTDLLPLATSGEITVSGIVSIITYFRYGLLLR